MERILMQGFMTENNERMLFSYKERLKPVKQF